jgi:hypothetical protein
MAGASASILDLIVRAGFRQNEPCQFRRTEKANRQHAEADASINIQAIALRAVSVNPSIGGYGDSLPLPLRWKPGNTCGLSLFVEKGARLDISPDCKRCSNTGRPASNFISILVMTLCVIRNEWPPPL